MSTRGEKSDYKVGPMLMGLFLFVIVGSAVLQIIQSAQGSGL